ncbi:hypothetical protein F5X99DRAFT_366296 [Biscogniauxia marginata]|nr:hypothetical protein F5X99DRAFT_366296 [Biscogniauxia marginata]
MRTTTLMSVKPRAGKPPKRNDDRVILHFDYDCFYASVFENENPALKSLPLGVKQKSILATCNYVARARGVRKLMLISEAQKVCPELVILNGEDLTRFRDTSKRLCTVLRAHSWNNRVERLGLDEVFLDVTDVVAYNAEMLNVHALRDSFFHLDRRDPEKGFAFDGTRFFGCVYPSSVDPMAAEDADTAVMLLDKPLCMRLMLASHLAGYLRHKLEEDFGYTSSGGISTNKVLTKLAGSVNKPKNQTTLLSLQDDYVQDFMDAHQIRKIPGIGSRIAQLIQDHVLSTTSSSMTTPHQEQQNDLAETGTEKAVTVKQVRQHTDMSPELLERILDRPGSERGAGEKIWNLLHGVDHTEVKEATNVPTQISIEDTYMSKPLNTMAEITGELHALSVSLVRRMRVDLTDTDPYATESSTTDTSTSKRRWLAYPKTLRLSTRTRPKPGSNNSSSSSNDYHSSFSRSSRSAPLPRFVLNLSSDSTAADVDVDGIASRLVSESLLPLFRRLHPERQQQGLNLALINICVTNMVMVAGEENTGASAGGRDIGRMFRTQEDKLREWTVYVTPSPSVPVAASSGAAAKASGGSGEDGVGQQSLLQPEGGMGDVNSGIATPEPATVLLDNDADAWDDDEGEGDSLRCPLCGHAIPYFAASAHERFHAMED